MQRTRAKELLPIIQAFAEGKTVQYINADSLWIDADDPLFIDSGTEYRIKPEVVRYRRALMKRYNEESPHIQVIQEMEGYASPEDLEKFPSFLRWIDTEWQEVEV